MISKPKDLEPIFIFNNKDKSHWQSRPDATTAKGFRLGGRYMICSPPNRGKTTLCFNKIVDSDPPYDIVYIYQASALSREYDNVRYIPLQSIEDLPKQEDIPLDKKILVIFEDMDTIPRKQLEIIDVWFRFSCSHLGVCCVLICQNATSIPVKLRRKIEVFTLFLCGTDLTFFKSASIPIPKEDKEAIIQYFRKHGNKHTFITIDLGIDDKYCINNELLLNL